MTGPALLATLVAVSACTSAGPPEPPPCPARDASACQAPVPSYAGDVAPILDRRCNRTCHAPGVGPWPLTDWENVSDWASEIQCSVVQGTMPPPGDDAGALSPAERGTLLDWLACGAPDNKIATLREGLRSWAVRARALCLSACLLWASSALGDDTTDFEKARTAYVTKDYVEADARFAAMLDPKTGTLKTPELVQQAEFGWGAVKLALGDKAGAHERWERVIRDSLGQYQPDPLTYPTNVINDFIQEKADLAAAIRQQIAREAAEASAQRKHAAEERARLQARVKELEKLASEEAVVVHNSRFVALLPFGVGQFQNRDPALGWAFLLSESAAVLTTMVLFLPYRYNVDQWNATMSDPTPKTPHDRIALANQYAAVAQNIRTADLITLGALGALAVAGILEAQIAFKPAFESTRPRKTASVWPSLAPAAGGAFVGLGGRF